jgi:uncharacterized protein
MKCFLLLFSYFSIFLSLTTISCSSTLDLQNSLKNEQAIEINTIHGSLLVHDPLVIELINCPAMQRLKKIRQYGIVDYVLIHNIEYNRYDHSLAVYFILHKHGAPRVEQIAGLLHDISHTVFSHATDRFFMGDLTKGAYQDTIHEYFLERHGIGEILANYGLNVHDVSPKNTQFRALEQSAPALCADRIEYNIHSAYIDNLLPQTAIEKIHNELHFDGHDWFFDTIDSAKKFALIPLHDMAYMWGSPCIILVESWFTEIIHRALALGLIQIVDILFNSTDEQLWNLLNTSADNEIQNLLYKIQHYKQFFSWREGHEKDAITLKTKFSGVDPLVKTPAGLVPLSKLDSEFNIEYERMKKIMSTGWQVAIHNSPHPASKNYPWDPRRACTLIAPLQQRCSVQEFETFK